MTKTIKLHRAMKTRSDDRRVASGNAACPRAAKPRHSLFISCHLLVALFFVAMQTRADDVLHPILTISGSGSGANTVTNIAESDYTNDFIPRSPPRNSAQGFVPAV